MSYTGSESPQKNSIKDEDNVDIIIIGAGLAGLTAAYNILRKKAGLRVLILEENDEIGGRILPTEFSIAFHGHFLQNHIVELLHDLEIPIYKRPIVSKDGLIFLTKYGPTESPSPFYAAQVHYLLRQLHRSSLDPIFTNYINDKHTIQLATTSVSQLLSQYVFSSYSRSLCNAITYSLCGIRNAQDISALHLLVLLNGAGGLYNRFRVSSMGDKNRFYVQGGMRKIIEKLAECIELENGKIIISEAAIEIQLGQGRVRVVTTKNIFECDYVILAVPPPESSRIAIDPPLPEFLSQVQTKYCHGKNTFFTVAYDRSFSSDIPLRHILSTSDSDANVRLAYVATHLQNETLIIAGYLNKSLQESCTRLGLFETLSRCFRTDTMKTYKKYTDWSWTHKDAPTTSWNTGGGGSPMSLLTPTNFLYHRNLLNTNQKRLFFTASEYAFNWAGTADGAIEAGKRTAYSVLLRTRPQSLNIRDVLCTASQTRIIRESLPFNMFIARYMLIMINIFVFLSFYRKR